MRHLLRLLLGTFLVTSLAAAQDAAFDQEHTLLTELLQEHVEGERVDYVELKKDGAKLRRYLRTLEGVTPTSMRRWTRAQKMAFWINAYNAYTLKLIVDNYPLDTIKDLGGWFSTPWEKRFIPLPTFHPQGKKEKLSLDDIEHEILRVEFPDARVHAAVNCASASCPALLDEAYTGARLEEQLDAQVKRWLADTTRNRFDREKNTIHVSKIFDWFEEDFERGESTVPKWVARYAPAKEAEWLRAAKKIKVKYLDYSWKLNDLPRKKR